MVRESLLECSVLAASTGPHSLECGMALIASQRSASYWLQRGRTRWSAEWPFLLNDAETCLALQRGRTRWSAE